MRNGGKREREVREDNGKREDNREKERVDKTMWIEEEDYSERESRL